MLLRSIGRPPALIRHMTTASVDGQGRLVRWTQGGDGVAVVTLCNPSKLNALTASASECWVWSVLFDS